MGSASQTLAAFITALRLRDVPAVVVGAAQRQILDGTGIGLAAAGVGACGPVVEMARSWGGAREAGVIGHDFGAPAALAALANGSLMRALDFDDTHPESLVHVSSVVVPAALAVGQETGSSGTDVLAAVIAGTEVCARIGAAAPGRFHAHGLDATSIAGPFGAAAAAGVLWGLSPEEITSAFGICASQSSGLLAYLGDGSHTMALHAGWASAAGVVAADLARRGMSGPTSVLDGPRGIYDALLQNEDPDRERLVRGLGTSWETARIAIKPYAASHFVHAFMDAAIRAGVKWGDIEEIECLVAPAVIDIVCEPRAPRLHPESAATARASLPFAVATAIVGGRAGLDLFGDEARADRRILTLAERIRHIPDPTLPFPASFGGRLRIHTRAGRTIEIDEEINRGHPDRPLSDDQVREKFLTNARARLDARDARHALHQVLAVETLETIETLAASLSIAR